MAASPVPVPAMKEAKQGAQRQGNRLARRNADGVAPGMRARQFLLGACPVLRSVESRLDPLRRYMSHAATGKQVRIKQIVDIRGGTKSTRCRTDRIR